MNSGKSYKYSEWRIMRIAWVMRVNDLEKKENKRRDVEREDKWEIEREQKYELVNF